MNDDGRIRWRCRRGMKELDVMLEEFLVNGYRSLSIAEKTRFSRLLDALDPDLYAWLSGTSIPDDAELASIVGSVRMHLRGGSTSDAGNGDRSRQ